MGNLENLNKVQLEDIKRVYKDAVDACTDAIEYHLKCKSEAVRRKGLYLKDVNRISEQLEKISLKDQVKDIHNAYVNFEDGN